MLDGAHNAQRATERTFRSGCDENPAKTGSKLKRKKTLGCRKRHEWRWLFVRLHACGGRTWEQEGAGVSGSVTCWMPHGGHRTSVPGEEECGKRHVWGFKAVFILPCALPSDVVVGSCTSGILPKAPRGTLGTLVHGDLGLLELGEAEPFIFQPPKLSNTQWCCWRKSWFCGRGCLAILCAPGELFRIKIIHN